MTRVSLLWAPAQSCFEGSMYTFVFMWTPALKTDEEEAAEIAGVELPDTTSNHLGMIFAIFMVSVMVGSSIFKIATQNGMELYKILSIHPLCGPVNFLITSMFIEDKNIVLIMFLCFEGTVGVFYPAYGVIKSEKIPEDIRAAVMNIFRIPLNFFVVLLLLKVKFLSPTTVFSICTVAQGISLACYYYFYSTLKRDAGPPGKDSDLDALLSGKDEKVRGDVEYYIIFVAFIMGTTKIIFQIFRQAPHRIKLIYF